MEMNIDKEIITFFRKNLRFTFNQKISDLNKKFPKLEKFYEEFLKSDKFKNLINIVKSKNDEEYLKLFLRHAKTYLNLKLSEKDNCFNIYLNDNDNSNNDKININNQNDSN
jgi:hypothetical protein